MIARLTGEVHDHEADMAIIDVRGVGYGVYVSVHDRAGLDVGKQATLYVYEHIRENGHDLFGFTGRQTKELFELLLSVNGVGPKGALAIINLGSDDTLRAAIANGDTSYITGASGIGKKVAERIVVDLKAKVGLVASEQATDFLKDLPQSSQDEALQALVALGFSPADAARALRHVDDGLPTEQRVKLALKGDK